jgi:hypothetical protein
MTACAGRPDSTLAAAIKALLDARDERLKSAADHVTYLERHLPSALATSSARTILLAKLAASAESGTATEY